MRPVGLFVWQLKDSRLIIRFTSLASVLMEMSYSDEHHDKTRTRDHKMSPDPLQDTFWEFLKNYSYYNY